MRKNILLPILTVILSMFSFAAMASEVLTIAVASSLYPAMQKQAVIFEKRNDVTVRLISGSTGRLYNQIMQGAPFDLFIAADQERPALLASQGRAVSLHSMRQAIKLS